MKHSQTYSPDVGGKTAFSAADVSGRGSADTGDAGGATEETTLRHASCSGSSGASAGGDIEVRVTISGAEPRSWLSANHDVCCVQANADEAPLVSHQPDHFPPTGHTNQSVFISFIFYR